ncbi:VOC family protein [Sphingomonas sp. SRS2]|uniref:VOC family protein n=1 Tax=Sphingomonas sp. SRS2 TaxID=133190 RepID=UPI0006184D0E|nr:VOC family protein [Sphingomonas sp. SRS2]KKC24228.1 glyoxalase [Sphingomonas sp. SRS2]
MSAFTHIVLGTNDIDKARTFYDNALAPLGMKRMLDFDHASMWGGDQPALMITRPANGEPATFANGGTVGLAASSRKSVDEFHAAGLGNGGTCDGKPGKRAFHPDAYGAYLRDPEGNKICAYSYVPD